ncbi:hypothetical protein BC938DRAFT_483661 [Jimgerdemannia flammicorona]|uniref:Uncharacterized protein n=1 Tax=Jimgerdemannia flammicorona TaxID=994334 RepID=A0A433QBJ6_9FUNG|nr:hypothetical protein BC938DRAFT_483661 [Jimgerdemannia flammicorona]
MTWAELADWEAKSMSYGTTSKRLAQKKTAKSQVDDVADCSSTLSSSPLVHVQGIFPQTEPIADTPPQQHQDPSTLSEQHQRYRWLCTIHTLSREEFSENKTSMDDERGIDALGEVLMLGMVKASIGQTFNNRSTNTAEPS